jgi:predicted neuraminidase
MRRLATLLVVTPAFIAMSASLFAVSQEVHSPVGNVSEQPVAVPQGILKAEFVFDSTPTLSVHASTILETRDGLVAAWFGGSREGADDVGIWMSRHVEGEWSQPFEVANGVQQDGTRHPCWNPVLFRMPNGAVTLFYKVGPSPQHWWGMSRTSRDDGRTWDDAERLPEGILGPIKNKPVQLADGSIISPSSTESTDRPSIWRVHFEWTIDAGQSWIVAHPVASVDAGEINAIQPTILIHSRNRLQAVGRTRSGRVFETWSRDGGRHWSPVTLTELPNPNAGLDGVTLRDGRHMIVYNHTTRDRSPLNVAISRDGTIWEAALVLEREAGEYSYPAVIQTSDALVHITYTWRRQRIKHVVVDPMGIVSIPMPTGEWPADIR